MNTPKQFLIQNSKRISEAIDNGYDVRLNEDEILMWMEKYSEYKIAKLKLEHVNLIDQLFKFRLYIYKKTGTLTHESIVTAFLDRKEFNDDI